MPRIAERRNRENESRISETVMHALQSEKGQISTLADAFHARRWQHNWSATQPSPHGVRIVAGPLHGALLGAVEFDGGLVGPFRVAIFFYVR